MLINNEDLLLLEDCCKDSDVNFTSMLELLQLETDYATKSRRSGIIQKLTELIEN